MATYFVLPLHWSLAYADWEDAQPVASSELISQQADEQSVYSFHYFS